MLLDTAGLGSEAGTRQLAGDVVRYLHSSRPAPGFEQVLVPGEAEFANLARTTGRGFVEVSEPLWAELSDFGQRLNIDFSTAIVASGGGTPA